MRQNYYQSLIVMAAGLAITAAGAYAKDKHPKADAPQDEIQVVGHVPVTDGPVTHFFSTQHYRRDYLYAESESGKNVTLIDVTKIDHPTVLAGVSYPAGSTSSDSLVAVTGNAALVTSSAPASTTSFPQTIRIMSFADPAHPSVKQEFKGVTAISRDEKRGLIFLANADGVWILQQHLAMDPEFVKEWEHMMLDAR